MLRHHIQKEDNVLFVIAENLLSPERKARMLHDFADKEHAPQQKGKHEHYVNLANTLAHWQFHQATVDA
ncbi:MAG: hypothetical protein IPK83_02720 [Planctomycetes bacterium]|nr:hypothetical protein [Planctomycetota bacterium]